MLVYQRVSPLVHGTTSQPGGTAKGTTPPRAQDDGGGLNGKCFGDGAEKKHVGHGELTWEKLYTGA